MNDYYPQPQPAAPPISREEYDYYRSMYDTFTGRPDLQTKVVGAYFDAIKPKKQSPFQQMLMSAMGMGGAPSSYGSPDLETMANANPERYLKLFTPSRRPPVDITTPLTTSAVPTTTGPTGTVPTPTDEGHFGIGTGTGELFGEGGAIGSIPLLGQLARGAIDFVPTITRDYIINPLAASVEAGAALLRGEGANPEYDVNRILTTRPLISGGQQQQETAEQYAKDPFLSGLKGASGFLSLAIPGAGGLASKVGLGAIPAAGLASAGAGFSTAKPGEELQSAALGGLLGLGGATAGKYLINPLMSRLGDLFGRASETLTEPSIGVDASKLKPSSGFKGVTGAAELESKATGILDDLGFRPKTRFQTAEAVDSAISSLQGRVGELTQNSGETFNTGGILDRFSKLFKNNRGVLENPDVQEIGLNLMDLGDDVSADKLAKYYFELQNKINFNRTTGNVPEFERALRGMQDIVGKELKTNVPGLSETMGDLSVLHRAQPFATAQAQKGLKIGLPLLTGPKLDVAPLTGRLSNIAGNVLNAGSYLPSVSGLAGAAPYAIGAGLNQRPSEQPVGTTTPTQTQKSSIFDNVGSQTPYGFSAQQGGAQSDQLRQIITMGVLSGELEPAEGKAYLDLLGAGDKEQGARLPASQVADISGTLSGLDDLQGLRQTFEQNKSLFDPVAGRLRSLNPYDVNTQKVDSIIYATKQIIGKGLEGGVLRAEDEWKYAKILPQITDTPAVVEQKLSTLEQMLGGKYSNLINSYDAAGYNISGFPTLNQ